MWKSPKLRLWDPNRVGTLILGNIRFGTHFLAKRVVEEVGKQCYNHGEFLNYAWNDVVVDQMKSLEHEPKYHVMTINNLPSKMALKKAPEVLDKWHVIRINHSDKVRWFISWYFYFHSESSEFFQKQSTILHNSTPRQAYLDYLSKSPVNLDDKIIELACANLGMQLINYHIPVDEEIDYTQLKKIAHDRVPWLENNYPSDLLSVMFSNSEHLESILKNWSHTIKGKFKENA